MHLIRAKTTFRDTLKRKENGQEITEDEVRHKEKQHTEKEENLHVTQRSEPQINWTTIMAAISTTTTMELERGDKGEKEGATIVELSPNPFSKAAAAAQRLKNKKKALHQANLFIEEAKEARTADEREPGKVANKDGGANSNTTGSKGKEAQPGKESSTGETQNKGSDTRVKKRRKPASGEGKRKAVTPESKEDPPVTERSKTTDAPSQEKGNQEKGTSATSATKNYLSALKTSKYTEPPIRQVWAYNRQIIKAQLQLGEGDRFSQYKKAIATLLHNGRTADPGFVINPIIMNAGRKDWTSPADVPSNFTMLASYIKLEWGSQRAFEAGNSKHNGKIYLQFAISCNAEPSMLLEMIALDWSQVGGSGLQVKEISAFNTESPFAIYFLSNDIGPKVLTEELTRIFETTIMIDKVMRKAAEERGDGADGDELLQTVPKMVLRKYPPKLLGADYSALTGGDTSGRAKEGRKVWHIEIEGQYKHGLRRLIERMKEFDTMSSYWGRLAHISAVPDRETTTGEIKKLTHVSQKHTCYQMSMITEVIKGIVNADGSAKLYNKQGAPCGDMSMREVLLKLFKTKDGTTLVAEVHQQHGLCPTEIVIPGSDEAAAMAAMMNRQAAAFCYYYLQDQGLPEQFARDLVTASCCPEQVAEISLWKWNKKQKILIAPKGKFKEQTEDLIKEFEALDCYKTLEKLKATASKSKGFMDPQSQFNLDEEKSIGTMHAENEGRRREQKRRQEEISESDTESEEATENEEDTTPTADGKVIDIHSDSDEESLSAESEASDAQGGERSWNTADEDDTNGSLSWGSKAAEGEIPDGWEEEDVEMEDPSEQEFQSDSSSTESVSNTPLGSEDNKAETSTQTGGNSQSSAQNCSSPPRVAGDE